jgi:2-keto-4-pentenoate hydratase
MQAEVARLSGQAVIGWKIGATSTAGQQHIGVDGPLAGRLLSERLVTAGSVVPIGGNVMKVAEAEFAFRFGRSLAARPEPFTALEVLDAVESLHPAIEIPDSRYADFARVGASQLIADMACACWVMIGPPVTVPWRDRSLADHAVRALRDGVLVCEGLGANVLGDPRLALHWVANELRASGCDLRAGDVVITGTCIVPMVVGPGDRVRMDFGDFGEIEAEFCE